MLCIIAMFGIACAFGVTYNLSLYISNESIGDLMLSAAAHSTLVVMAAVAGLLYQFILKKAKAFCMNIAFAISALGYVLLALFPNVTTVLVAVAIVGFGYGLIAPSCIQAVTNISAKQQIPSATSGIIAFGGIGAALTPFIANPLATLMPIFASVGATNFLMCGIGFVILCAFTSVWYPALYKKRAAEIVQIDTAYERADWVTLKPD